MRNGHYSDPLPWWKKQSLLVSVGTLVALVLFALIVAGYWFGLTWTGFLHKTLWDWMQLLIVPAVLAVIAFLFNFATSRTEQHIATQRYEQDQMIALDKQREDLLQSYLDRMSELLLKEHLRESAPETEVRNVARVRTITVLYQLDAKRISYVFAFLREAGLMSNKPNTSIVSLSKADLSNVNWSQANLSAVNLSGADLTGANLSAAFLYRINLSGADLTGANLSHAHLNGADLRKANLSCVDLESANLSGANLSKTNLSSANLSGANLKGADLSASDLSGANLTGATVTDGQLRSANCYESTVMPAGERWHPDLSEMKE